MEWMLTPCSCCRESILVPAEVAARVFSGDSNIVCEGCLEGSIEHYDAEAEGGCSTNERD